MPDIRLIIILVLIGLSYYQYAYPESSQQKLAPVWGKVQDKFGSFNNPVTQAKETAKESICPDTYNPVCGSDGITYDNICKAAAKNILEVTQGVC